jgi:hypothetical protein
MSFEPGVAFGYQRDLDAWKSLRDEGGQADYMAGYICQSGPDFSPIGLEIAPHRGSDHFAEARGFRLDTGDVDFEVTLYPKHC